MKKQHKQKLIELGKNKHRDKEKLGENLRKAKLAENLLLSGFVVIRLFAATE